MRFYVKHIANKGKTVSEISIFPEKRIPKKYAVGMFFALPLLKSQRKLSIHCFMIFTALYVW